ncbi:Luciferase-like monooxygenase [Beutenbergia cavernae DSM 12333]|uniref:Luciferase-like monooxygenase n=1 Tax=Beutenbergia cavernae (strain ATCC BAA-8 / DSM 12333 / CCUG 43141 / JCM 11478 / NBRC 16432 / NCIMB 13614 / HKI 0122) TaxID=471853 RepID=C5BYZ1_BEUC1|nr:Luciferase-like monooxygenase [Beutenbergia cavernae DSM 12333]
MLDLASVSEGMSSGDALAATTAIARRADELGFARFWVAEHHSMPAVASTTPPVLIAHLAAATERIRVGSGGVMLPNHAPLVVAEQFAMLEALHPSRIDLGIGRAPGADPATAAALRRTADGSDVADFPQHVLDVLGLLGDPRGATGLAMRFTATPAADGGPRPGASAPPVWLLGSSGYSAQLAGELGLPFSYAHHFNTPYTDQALALYRSSFRPSPALDAPRAMVSASVIVADTSEEADYLAGPSRVMALSLRRGTLAPIVPPERAAKILSDLSEVDRAQLDQLPGTQIRGTAEHAVTELEALAARTQSDELMVTATTFDPATRIGTLEALAAAW